MDKSNRNQENDEDENVYGMRKITYLEKYRVEHFPYPGRRKYTPLINKYEEGGMFISNDVFGLTIRQFERMYKDCLKRRKTHEQWILNLRYPDKSSNEYLEYLQNCTDCNKEHSPWPENKLKEKELFELLVKTVGTEKDIRTRQRLFIVNDLVVNSINKEKQISSGSLAEGLDLRGSDVDIMVVISQAVVIRNVRNTKYFKTNVQHVKHSKQQCIFVMETDNDHPGFTRLRLIAAGETLPITSQSIEFTTKGLYLTVNGFLNGLKIQHPHVNLIRHGPCLTFSDESRDVAFCLRRCFKLLTLTESLRKSELSAFIADVCKYEYNRISKFAVQLLPPPTTKNKMYKIHKRYHEYLQVYLKTDAVSGWLLYASFYYVTGQYAVTLKLIDYVLSRCSTDLLNMEYTYREARINSYRQNVHSTMTFIERIKIAVSDSVFYMENSSLIPGELQLEVENSCIAILPITMSHCLRFLCYNHLGEIINRQQALRDLHLRVKEDCHNRFTRSSDALTILGVCMELSGDKNAAYDCFHEALQCDFIICPSAEIRISKLFDV
ncbi:unnamed protein product [Mytilus coruscus]|uniref:Mab-21-like HhH/H2TH-like domain-containing protein n=1 Tax=Mytilus coruscus TaxID=42192 RepID=A0A6J8CQG7_MYTCO|nr:unnamed protein product [Mytilus coruscus]